MRTFVIIEAKMFQNLTQSKFSEQMKNQRRSILEPIKAKFHITDDRMFHVALVPAKLNFTDKEDYQILNWEFFLNSHNIDVEGSYFYSFLKYALANYERLVADGGSGTWGQASTVKEYMKGRQVYECVKNGQKIWVGRKKGSIAIIQDVKSGKWTSFDYSINDHKPEKGHKGNWISSKEFAEIVDSYG